MSSRCVRIVGRLAVIGVVWAAGAQLGNIVVRPGGELHVGGMARAAEVAEATIASIDELLRDGRYARAEVDARQLLRRVSDSQGMEPIEVAQVLDRLVEAIGRLGRTRILAADDAVALAERAVQIKTDVMGENDVATARSLRGLGMLQIGGGDLATAKSNLERALAIEEKASASESHPGDDAEVARTLLVLSAADAGEGDYAAARASLERAVPLAEKAGGPERALLAALLTEYGNVLLRGGDYAAARAKAERARALNDAALRPGHPLAGRTLIVLGRIEHDTGNLPAARDLYEKAGNIFEAAFGADSAQFADSINRLGMVDELEGDLESARSRFERTRSIYERAYGPESVEVASTLISLANVANRGEDYERAIALYEAALEIREAASGPDHIQVATIVNNLGSALMSAGRYRDAEPYIERARAIWEKTLGPEHPYTGSAWNNLGNINSNLGDFEAALPLYRRAVAIWEASLGPDHPQVGMSYYNIALALKAKGDYAGALPAAERSVEILGAALGEEHPDVAWTLDGLAEIRAGLGDYREARSLYGRALAIRETSLGSGDHSLAWSLGKLATLSRVEGKPEEARALAERALEIMEQALGPDHPDVAWRLVELASLLRDAGELKRARPMYERAIAIWEGAYGQEHPHLAFGLGELADLLARSGDSEGAEPLFRRAIEMTERTVGPWHPDVAVLSARLADLLWEEGRRAEALTMARDASLILDRHIRATVAVLPERQALLLVAARIAPERVLFSGLLSEGDDRAAWLDACWDWSLRQRGLVLEALAARHRTVWASESPAAREAGERLARARRRLATLWIRGLEDDDPEVYRGLLDDAIAEKEQAETDLARRSARFEIESEARRTTLDEVRRALPPGAALVEMVRIDVRAARAAGAAWRDVALILGGDGEARFADLGPADRTDAAIDRWRSALEASGRLIIAGDEAKAELAELDRAGTALRRLIWDPIVGLAGEPRTVFFVPEGPANRVAFSALPAEDGRFLSETGPAVHLLTTGRDLPRLRRADPGPADRVGRGLLALGAPDFDAERTAILTAEASRTAQPGGVTYRGETSACAALRNASWPPLPESQREVRRIGELFGEREATVIVTGAEASEERFKQEAPGKRILHLATHGFFLNGVCDSALSSGEGSVGALSRGTTVLPSAGMVPFTPASENPLLLSGLVLAGANRAAGDAGDDGILTAEEVAALDLRGVELAVLSACDTGHGDVAVGEGVFGLRRALEMAGVRAIVMSLWPVPDRQARRWMKNFYTHRLNGDTLIDATRAADLETLHALRERELPTHPYLWTGFVAVGDWR